MIPKLASPGRFARRGKSLLIHPSGEEGDPCQCEEDEFKASLVGNRPTYHCTDRTARESEPQDQTGGDRSAQKRKN